MARERFVAEDFFRLSWLGAPFFTPDARRIVYTVRKIEAGERYRTQIMVIDLETEVSRTYTNTLFDERIACVTDEHIVLLSDRAGPERQVFLLPLHGGEMRQLTRVRGGVESVWIDPREQYGAVLVHVYPGAHVQPDDAAAKRREESARSYVVPCFHYRTPERPGLWDGTFKQLGLVDMHTGDVRIITDGTHNVDTFTFSPCGNRLAVTSKRDDDEFADTSDVYLLDLPTGNIRKLSKGNLSVREPRFSADGTMVACYGHDLSCAGATHENIYVMTIDGSSCRPIVPAHFTFGVGDRSTHDMRAPERMPGPIFTAEGDGVLAPYSAMGAVSIAQFQLSTLVRSVASGERQISSYDFHPASGLLTFVMSDSTATDDLYIMRINSALEKKLTDVNPWVREKALAVPVTYMLKGYDGIDLQGWCMMPPEEAAAPDRVPVIAVVPGRAHGMIGHVFSFVMQLLASAGFAIVYGNPRGYGGYSQKFTDANRGDCGGTDGRDVLAIIDSTLSMYPSLDPDRMGIMGESYGGFLTNWIATHTDRFKAAVAQGAVSNWTSFLGTSVDGYRFVESEFKWVPKVDSWNDGDALWDRSPVKYASGVVTPLLLMHGEQDRYVPIEQAEQMYAALRRTGKTAEFVRFPHSGHDFGCAGPPSLRHERHLHLLNWFRRHI